jgi:hypothetical protein
MVLLELLFHFFLYIKVIYFHVLILYSTTDFTIHVYLGEGVRGKDFMDYFTQTILFYAKRDSFISAF